MDKNYITIQDAFACLMYVKLSTDKTRSATYKEIEEFSMKMMDAYATAGNFPKNMVKKSRKDELLTDFSVYSYIHEGNEIFVLRQSVTKDDLVYTYEINDMPEEISALIKTNIDNWQKANGQERYYSEFGY